MIRDYQSVLGASVLEFDSGDLLALVTGIIVHPDTGVVEAFWVKPLGSSLSRAVLRSADILEFKKHLYVRSAQVLAEAEEVIRVSEILNEGRFFLENTVQNEAGDSYGHCVNLSFDTDSFMLQQLYCKKTFLKLLTLDERIFSYEAIIEVFPKMIVVRDDARQGKMLMASTPEAAAS